MLSAPFEPPAGHRLLTGVDQRDLPGLARISMRLNALVLKIDVEIALVGQKIDEVILDYRSLVSAAYDELV